MQALTVTPGKQDSLQLRELPDPPKEEGSVQVEAVAVGLCGTDREIVAGAYGQPPEVNPSWCWVMRTSAA
ncbi:MAG TPA: hypothetical protein VES01_02695 [Dermatophilaceae bacterium]|nr:hypothetical protein [Dermatophilaceae bacterium]